MNNTNALWLKNLDDELERTLNAKKKILAVDDNGPTLRVIKAMLESELYDVTIVNSGMNAMKAIGKSRPDLVLLDYEMPVCDGRQVFEMIRADDEIKDIPVVFLTGVNDREHIEPILALRPAGYLLKPLDKKKLLETIRKALGEA
ncbi:MAG: response regulator [Fretibacterium sp.]|nr:response regulator [Fretibacterium sp.]